MPACTEGVVNFGQTPKEEKSPIQLKTTREVIQQVEAILGSVFNPEIWNGRADPNAIREAFSSVVVPIFKIIGRHVNLVLEGLKAKYAETNDDQWSNLHELANNLLWNKGFNEPAIDKVSSPASMEEGREHHLRDALNVLEMLKGHLKQLAQGSSHNLPTEPLIAKNSQDHVPSREQLPIQVKPTVLSSQKPNPSLSEPQFAQSLLATDGATSGSSFVIVSRATFDASNCISSYVGMTPHTQCSSNGASSFAEIGPPSTESFERVSQAHSQESIPPTSIMDEDASIDVVNLSSSSERLDAIPSPTSWAIVSGPNSHTSAIATLSLSTSPLEDDENHFEVETSQDFAFGPNVPESPFHGKDLSEDDVNIIQADAQNDQRFQVTLVDPTSLQQPDPHPAPPPLPVATMPYAFPAIQQRILNHTSNAAQARHAAEMRRRMESTSEPDSKIDTREVSNVFQPPKFRPTAHQSVQISREEEQAVASNCAPFQRPVNNAILNLNSHQLDIDQRIQEWNTNTEHFVRQEQQRRLEKLRREQTNAPFGQEQPSVAVQPSASNSEHHVWDNNMAALSDLGEKRPDAAPPIRSQRRQRESQANSINLSSRPQKIKSRYQDPSRL